MFWLVKAVWLRHHVELGLAVLAGAVSQDSRRRSRGASSQQRIRSDQQQLPSAAPRAVEPSPAGAVVAADRATDAALADLLQVSSSAVVVVLLMPSSRIPFGAE